MPLKKCIFCQMEEERKIITEAVGFVVLDQYPVNKGHCLIIPNQHYPTYFDVPQKTQIHLWELVNRAKQWVDEKYHPDGYNIGINAGKIAGQTIMHLHIHLITRYQGDMEDPRGGVRGVIPSKQKYSKMNE